MSFMHIYIHAHLFIAAIYAIHLVNKEAVTKIYNYNAHKQSVIHRTIALTTYPSLGDDVGHHPPKGEALTGGVPTGTTTPNVAALPAPRPDGDRVPRPPLPRRELDFVNRFIPDSRFGYGFGLKIVKRRSVGDARSWGIGGVPRFGPGIPFYI
jgi:hypothetical protein